MIDRYFQEELAHLKELAAEFAAAHPALAPMLGAASTDPDVERLLEGVAFQNSLLREKLEDDFPEFIHDLARLLCPHYLRPVPAATLVAFSPVSSLTQCQTIPAGTQLASVPVEGTQCLFRTCQEVELHPLELRDASFVHPAGEAAAISISLALNGISLDAWSPRSLRLFLAGGLPAAADLYFLLRRHVRRIVLTPEEGGQPLTLPATCLQSSGFSALEPVIPYPSHAFPGYRLIQEYFAIPQRFLFLDLLGWEHWVERGRGSRFTIRFELTPFTLPPPRVKSDTFLLHVTPAVNLFPHEAAPIRLDHRRERYGIVPDGLPSENVEIFSVDRVAGLRRESGREVAYHPFELFRCVTGGAPSYHTTSVSSPLHSGVDTYLSVAHPGVQRLPQDETLSVSLTCTNGSLPEVLRIGDICLATASSPESATFRNVCAVSPAAMPPLNHDLLWRLVSHQALTLQSFSSAEKVRALLSLYLFDEDNRDNLAVAANRRRIEGIESVACVNGHHLVRGLPVQGTHVTVRVRGDHFAGLGDLYLFGCVLDEFLSGLASLNTYTRLTIHETLQGGTLEWHPRLGERQLL